MEEIADLIYYSVGIVLFCIGITLMVAEKEQLDAMGEKMKENLYQQHVLSVNDGWSEMADE